MVTTAAVAFVQGPVAFNAALKASATLGATPEAFDSLAKVFQAVHKEAARFAVVAIESSTAGTSHAVYDLVLEHGLRIVSECYELTPEATTRFVALAKLQDVGTSSGMLTMNPSVAAKRSLKTSFVISFPSSIQTHTNNLHQTLSVLASRNVDVLKIEGRLRSADDDSNQDILCLDVAGSETSPHVAAALLELRELTQSIRVLGSYMAVCEKEDTSVKAKPLELEVKDKRSMTEKYPLSPMVTDAPLGRNLMIVAMAKKMEAEGEQVHSLCIGEPDFLPSERAVEAGVRALREGKVKYSQLRGDPSLRQAITKYLNAVKGISYDPDTEIQVTAGAQQALYHALYSLIRPGDKVILPSPYWAAYEAIIKQVQAGVVRLPGKAAEDYLINPKTLEETLIANPTTKVLMLCNPSNPAGTLLSPERLEEIAAVLRKPQFQHVVVLADEIYEQIIYQDEGLATRVHKCFATLPGMRERTLIINGFSKAFAMAGLRIGFIAGPSYFIEPCMVLQGHFTSTANTPGQLMAAEALHEELEMFEQGKSRIAPVLASLNDRRQLITRRLRAIPNVTFAYPTAAFYLFMDLSAYFEGKRALVTRRGGAQVNKESAEVLNDVAEFCEFVLREYHVAISPGVDFGEDFGIRISYAAKIESVAHGMDALEHALQSLTFEQV